MNANESRTVSSANATPKPLAFLNSFRSAAGLAPIAPNERLGQPDIEHISNVAMGGFSFDVSAKVNGAISFGLRGQKYASEDVPGWLDDDLANDLRGKLMRAIDEFSEIRSMPENERLGALLKFNYLGYDLSSDEGMEAFVRKHFIAFPDAVALASLYFIVASGHLADFADVLRAIDENRINGKGWPIGWSELKGLLFALFDRDIVNEPACYLDDYPEQMLKLASVLQGVSHE